MKTYLENYAKENHIPIIRPEVAEFLADFCRKNQPKNILEIGTAIGYSGLIILENCSQTTELTTLEIDSCRQKMAKEALKGRNVNFVLGDAADYLKTATKKFDLIFLDGPKAQYINYLPLLENLLEAGGTLIADNVLFNGMVESEEYPSHKKRTIVFNLRKFIESLKNNSGFETQIIHEADGLLIAKKR